MRSTVIALAMVAVFAAACESTPDDTGAATGTSTGTGMSTGVGMDSGGGYGRSGVGTGGYGSTGTSAGSLSAAQMQKAQQQLVEVGDRVFFGFDRYDLDEKARTTLDGQVAFLNVNPSITIIVEGHADQRGTREYNLALGDRRAASVKDYLVAVGVSPSRIRTISYGDERPAVLGSTEEAYAKNRRAVTVIAGGPAS